jgi:hypothetical protein
MKLLYGILLLGLSSVIVMGQTIQISFSQNATNDLGTLSEPNATSTQAENDTDQLGQAASNETVGWQTYRDSENGFTIQYPTEWKIDEGITIIKPILALTPDDESTNILERTEVSVRSTPIEDSRTLDPETLQVKEIPFSLEDYAKSQIMSFPDIDVLKNEAVTLNGEQAWSLNFITIDSLGSQLSYSSSIYVIKDKELFEINFLTPPLKVPEMRPIGEKIIESFQLTTPRAPAPNATESTDSVLQSDLELGLPKAPLASSEEETATFASPDEENSDEENSEPDEDE